MSGTPTSGEQKIIIEFPEGSGGGESGKQESASPNPAAPEKVDNSSKDKTKGDNKSAAAIALGVQAAKSLGLQAINASISNIGLTTGNYAAQRRAERTVSSINQTTGLIMAAKGGWVTMALALGSMVISAATEYKTRQTEIEISNYEAAQQARRLGYSRYRQ